MPTALACYPPLALYAHLRPTRHLPSASCLLPTPPSQLTPLPHATPLCSGHGGCCGPRASQGGAAERGQPGRAGLGVSVKMRVQMRDGGAGGRMTFLGWGGCCGCCRDNSSGVRGPLAACMLQRRVCCSARGSCCLRACSAHVCRTAHSCSLPPGHTGALHWFHILLFGGSTQG